MQPAVALLLAVSATRDPAADASLRWPDDLVRDLTAITVQRRRGVEPPRSTRIVRRAGVWQALEPRRGEADPDALARLLFVLSAPSIVGTSPARPAGEVAFELTLVRGRAVRRVTIWRAALGAPVPVAVDGAGVFLVDPVELATKVPDPQDLLPAGLWVSAQGQIRSVRVVGPVRYAVRRGSGALGEVAAVLTGRHAVGAPAMPLSRLGLDPPVATATACARAPRARANRCRTFRFGEATVDGRRRTFAVGPGMDPIELRDDAWRVLVRGPSAPPR